MTTIYEAASQGDIEAVRRLLASGTPVDEPGEYEQTALMAAAAGGFTEIVRILLAAGADPRRENSLALDFAVRLGEPTSVQLLLGAGADPNRAAPQAPDDDDDSDDDSVDPPPLADALQRGEAEIVRLLIEAGARVDVVHQGRGLLAFAITANNVALFEDLAKRGASIAGAVHAVADSGHVGFLDRLIEMGATLEAPPGADSVMVTAAASNHAAVLQRLIELGAPLEEVGNLDRTALGIAVFLGHVKCAKVLLEAGAIQTADDGLPLLLCAIDSGRPELVRLLLSHGADADDPGDGCCTPLLHAIRGGRVKSAEVLIDHGADVNRRHDGPCRSTHAHPVPAGATPLIAAARFKRGELVERLLAAGAEASLTDARGRSAADHAARRGDVAMMNRLVAAGAPLTTDERTRHNAALLTSLRHADAAGALAALGRGADANAADRDGRSALIAAARGGMVEVVEALLAAGADPNHVAKWGESPLRVSALRRNSRIVRSLLAAGADVNARQVPGSIPADERNTVFISGESALHDAAAWGSTDVLEALLEAGADVNFAGDADVTPLVAAVNHRRMDSARLLLAAGAVVRPQDELWIAPYRFAERAEQPAFQAAARQVAGAIGVAGEPIPNLPGALGFRLSLNDGDAPGSPPRLDTVEGAREWGRRFAKDYAALDERATAMVRALAEPVERAGFLLLDGGKPLGCGPMVQFVVLLPTGDKFEAMAAFGVRGNDDELRTDDIIRWFRALEREEPFHLKGLRFDTVIIEFLQIVKRPDDLARRMCEFCSDLMSGAEGDRVEAVAKALRSGRRIEFWWD